MFYKILQMNFAIFLFVSFGIFIFRNKAEIRNRRSFMFDEMFNILDYMGMGDDHYADDQNINPEAFLMPAEIIQYHGYPAETHSVITVDGYILELHRIPYSRYNETCGKKFRRPVLVQHGFLSASSTWLINGQRDSLGFVLSDEGYDVWLGNFRGNRFSRRHTTLSPDSNEFWRFSLDEFALIDLPAMIDYVLSITNRDQLTLIGHSMGATVGVLMLAAKPEYNRKLNIAAFQAPVVYARYLKNPLRLLAIYPKEFREIWSIFGSDEVLPSTEFGRSLAQTVCNGRPGVIACAAIIMMASGYNEELLNEERMHVFFSHFPAGTSFNVINHFTQFFRSGKPLRFDYGQYENLAKYGQATPLEYNISEISAPVAIFYGYMDLYTDRKDLDKLTKQIKSLRLFEMVPYDLWTHQDFQFAKDARIHHYNRLLEVISGNYGNS